ncbi:hypothetical protein HU200_010591 [Digitaria exilis]|uniref:DNA polymerase n=1 Tax=Digitaria exilis TaxID=1010633 RepID=A0A835FHP3_9POAL|nr:hypothetical protein HU200_010591 [Digitaria exilis]
MEILAARDSMVAAEIPVVDLLLESVLHHGPVTKPPDGGYAVALPTRPPWLSRSMSPVCSCSRWPGVVVKLAERVFYKEWPLVIMRVGERERVRVKCVYERMDDASGDAAGSGRRTRTRGAEAVARSAALDRIRSIREGRTRAADAVHVKVDAPIYDTVAEEDYAALVIRRRKEAGEFIIDDDGLGYAEDGREEDWTDRALPSSSDEGSDGEDGARRKRKQPRPPQPKRQPQQSAAAASLSAAAAMMGKQRISSMFTSTVFKKPGSDRAKGSALAADSIVDDVIAEFAPDENDREERRRRVGRVCAPQHPPPTVFYFNSENVALDAETVVRSDSGFDTDRVSDHGNDMTVELKSDAEIDTKLEENPGSSAELVVEDKSSEELKEEANGEAKIEKVEVGKRFHSCCVIVKNIQRCIYAIPNQSVFPRESISGLEKKSTSSDFLPSFRAALHELASGLKSEIADKLSDLNVSNFVMTPVKRNYAFERTDLPNGEQYVLKINYPYKDPALPADLRGEYFHALLGTSNSALELFLIKRKIKGPSWLSVSKFVTRPSTQRIDSPMRPEDWQKRGMLSHFSVMRKLEGSIFPMGLAKEATDRNQKAGCNVLALESRLTKGNTLYGSGASPGIMSCIAGRLLCDTYLCSRDLLKEVEYGETDAWLSLELMFHLSVLPLTRQLTNISGNLWGKTLQGARAQRVEYLLLHSFHAKKFIVPDKFVRNKEQNSTKRKMNADTEGANADDGAVDPSVDVEGHNGDQGKARKGPSYAGGLVLEPKKGLYDKYVLLLDFNSLYPSIIQEYNICFTTVERSSDGNVPNLPASKATGVLPELLRSLVERRRMVKSWLKTASGIKRQQFDIQQQALKLTANSMYGCLGFSNSRFYAKPLAELITLQGREILQNTVDLVQNNLNLEVIYGDTDSIMIHTGLDDISRAKAIAGKVIQEVNKKYRCLEIDLDGIYKRMLLLKKKKYAAIKVALDGSSRENIERKGLDMVRRDWSLLSKEIGDFCLNQILSGGTCDDVVESIHSSLVQVKEQMRSGQIELQNRKTYCMTTGYNLYWFSQVAVRLRQNGYSGCSAGDTVPYIICSQQDSDNTHTVGIAQRARHPEELKRDPDKYMIDIDYYLSQQVLPHYDMFSFLRNNFQSRLTESSNQDTSAMLLSVIDDEDERYRGCEPLRLSCPSCSSTFDCPPVSSLIASASATSVSDSDEGKDATTNFWCRMRCPRCPDNIDDSRISPPVLANQMKRQADNFINQYYKGLLMYTEANLYRQLSYFCYVLDATRCLDKLDQKARLPFEKEFAAVSQTINLALMEIQKIRDRCAFGWVQLKDLAVSI